MHADHEIRRYQDVQFPYSAFKTRNLQFMAHWHDEIEIILVLEGKMVMGLNQKEHVLVAGDIGVSTSQDIHYYTRQGDSTIIILIFRPELIPRGAGWLALPQDATGSRCFRNPEATTLIETIQKEMVLQAQDWQTAILGHTAALSALVGRALFPHPATGTEPRRHLRMQKALQYLREHFREDLTMEQVAHEVALSPWAFSHQFSPTVGMNFRSYLNGLRILEARRLLADPQRKVIDVALECGFTSLRSFNRAFKQQTSETPSVSRQGS